MSITGAQFVQHVKVKLNRLDTSSYEDVRPEEILFYSNDALKSLTLAFDLGLYSGIVNEDIIKIYLAQLHKHADDTEVDMTANAGVLPTNVLKFKDMEAYVTIGSEVGWVDTRDLTNEKNSSREDNPFTKSFADEPIYRLITSEAGVVQIKFEVNGFTVTKIRYDYLIYPIEITEASTLTYQFLNELEDKTVTLILENLESRRMSSQPATSRS
jgi:hypothetical protein